MWTFLMIAGALATELVAPWDARGTPISPRTTLDDALMETGAPGRPRSYLQLTGDSFVIADARFQLYTRVGAAHAPTTLLVAERNQIRSQIALFTGDNALLDAQPVAGDRVLVTWGADAAAYASLLAFGDDGVLQKLARDIPVRIGILELKLSFPSPDRLKISGSSVTASQARWLGRHRVQPLPPQQTWYPRDGGIPLGPVTTLPDVPETRRTLAVSEYLLKLGDYGDDWIHDAVWIDAPQGQLPLLQLPNQNGRPIRPALRAFRRLHGHIYWAEVELVVADVNADITYRIGWVISLRRDEARILADQIPVRASGLNDTRLAVSVPLPDTLVIEAETSELSDRQRRWLGTWTLE
jgi:hypothetical protein